MSSHGSGWKGTQARRWFALLLLAISGLLLGMPWRSWAQEPSGWSPPINLSESHTRSYYPDVAVDSAGHVYVVWGEYSSDHEGAADMLMFQMWDGQTWSPPNDIAFQGHLPQIAVDSQGRLHLIRVYNGLSYTRAWAQGDPSNAQAWTPDRDIGIGSPYWPDMVVDSQDRIHVAFIDEGGINEGGINYTRSTDGGDSWSDPVQLDPHVSAETPRLAVDRFDNVYVTWQYLAESVAGESPSAIAVGFSVSTDGGGTWSQPRKIATGETGYEWPQAAVDSTGTIHVVWYYRYTGNVGCVRSLDGGESWSQVERLRLPLGGAYSIGLAIDSADNLHLVAPSKIDGLPGVSHLVRPPGREWLPPTSISRNPCSAASADVELVISEGNHLHAVWYDRLECELGWIAPSGRGEVFYSDFVSDALYITPQPLPPMPTPTAIVPTAQSISTPAPASAETGFTPEPTTTGTPPATPSSPNTSSAEDAQAGRWLPNPLLVGPALAGALVVVVVVLRSATIGRP